MKKRMNKKGAEISLNFIIIAILGVIALIGIAFFFLGGAKFFAQKEKATTVLTENDRSLAEAACDLHCSTENKGKWDVPGFSPQFVTQFGSSTCEGLLSGRTQGQGPKVWADCVAPEAP